MVLSAKTFPKYAHKFLYEFDDYSPWRSQGFWRPGLLITVVTLLQKYER